MYTCKDNLTPLLYSGKIKKLYKKKRTGLLPSLTLMCAELSGALSGSFWDGLRPHRATRTPPQPALAHCRLVSLTDGQTVCRAEWNLARRPCSAWRPSIAKVPHTLSLPSSLHFHRPHILGSSTTLQLKAPGLEQCSQNTNKTRIGAMEITGRALQTAPGPASTNCQQSDYIHVSNGFNC